jgi:D-alanyl-D-alanine endopeptidase (penicillin-binding protein 7)
MKPRLLFAMMMALALTLSWGGFAVAAPGKCNGAAKTRGACKPASTSMASKYAGRKKGKTQAVSGKKANRMARVKSTLAKRLAAAKRGRPARSSDEPIVLRVNELGEPQLSSGAFYVINQTTGEVLLQKRARDVIPIASITKLMTAIVVLESGKSLNETLTITDEDVDYLKGTSSRLGVGTRLTREEMLQLALMSSENRAASALGRNYPGGRSAFVEAMNAKARLLGMHDTHFYDTTGLTPRNVSSPRDLSRLVIAASAFSQIQEFSTTAERYVYINDQLKRFGNTNGLVKSADWNITLSKTGYISEAGRCLVMQAWMDNQPLVIVLMDADGRNMRVVDAQRVRMWLEQRPERIASSRRSSQG